MEEQINQSIVHRWLRLFPISQAIFEFHLEQMSRPLRRSFFWKRTELICTPNINAILFCDFSIYLDQLTRDVVSRSLIIKGKRKGPNIIEEVKIDIGLHTLGLHVENMIGWPRYQTVTCHLENIIIIVIITILNSKIDAAFRTICKSCTCVKFESILWSRILVEFNPSGK